MITIVEEKDAKFITHAGSFHPDEVMATVLLEILYGDIDLARVAEIDEKGTAKSIYNSAKKRTKAKIETSSENKLNLANRVEIDLSNQTITLVREDKSIGVWPIVTGGPGYRTPPGLFALAYKTSPATLKGKNADGSDYESHVTFWMPFNGGIGIHDADGWRSAYGGSIYVYGGSHGCVNVPYSAAETIFYNVSAGMPVIVHY